MGAGECESGAFQNCAAGVNLEMVRILSAQPLPDFKLAVTFSDGSSGIYGFVPEVAEECFSASSMPTYSMLFLLILISAASNGLGVWIFALTRCMRNFSASR